VTQASVVTRMRTGDIRSVPLAFWLFAILTAFDAYLYIATGAINDLSDVMSLFTFAVAPLLFATAVAWVQPVDLRYLWGAAFIAASELPNLIEMSLTQFLGFSFDWGLGLRPSSLTWGLELIGVALVALAIGGIHQRRNWLWPALGLAIFIIGDIENAFFWSGQPAQDPDFATSPLVVAITFVGGLTILAWSYLLGSAIERRRWLFALGSGIFVALGAFGLFDELVFPLFPPPTDGGFSLLYWPLTATNVVGWVAMIVAALREVPRRGSNEELAEALT